MPRIRFTYANVVATLALVLALSGGAIAATHYLITSTHQISPRVLRALRGRQGPPGQQGPTGQSGQGPAFAVYNDSGYSTTTPSDNDSHSIATLTIPQAGSYVVSAKTVATVLGFGTTNQALAECVLTAHTGGASTGDDSDRSFSYLGSIGDQQVLTLEVSHQFSGPGTVNLSCDQNGLFSGGTDLRFDRAKIIATQVSSLSNTAVSS